MSSQHLALHKYHFDISYVRFDGGYVGPYQGFGEFMIGVWKCHLDTWLCPRILLTYHICGLVEAKEV